MAQSVRVSPEPIHLHDRRGEFEVGLDLSGLRAPTLTIDIYGYQSFEHPDRHLGWWRFRPPADCARLVVSVDFGSLGEASVRASGSAEPLLLEEAWVNPDYVVEPVQRCLVLVREEGSEGPTQQGSLLLNETDQAVLARYAEHVHRVEGYRPRLSRRESSSSFPRQQAAPAAADLRQVPAMGRAGRRRRRRPDLFTELVEWKLWSGIPYRLVCSDVPSK